MALIYWVALFFFPEKSAGRAAFSSEVCVDMTGGGGGEGPGGAGPTRGAVVATGSESDEASGAGDEHGASWGFLEERG